nr:MAG TPA: hypothetical protein [Caudoviricetes sp.]
MIYIVYHIGNRNAIKKLRNREKNSVSGLTNHAIACILYTELTRSRKDRRDEK